MQKNMVILVDTNIIIDFLMTREPYYKASSEIVKKCANGELTGYIAFHSVSNLWYIFRKIPEDRRREWLADICSFIQVTGASHDEVLKAIILLNAIICRNFLESSKRSRSIHFIFGKYEC